MTSSRFGRIDRRRVIASTAILGGTAMLPSGQSLLAGGTPGHQGNLLADGGTSVGKGIGGPSGRVNALRGTEASTAYELEITWSFEIENYGRAHSELVLVDDVLFFSTNDDVVFAVDVTTGTERWRSTTLGATTQLVVVDGVVYFGSQEDHYYAVDALEGTVIWRFENPGRGLSPQVVDGVVYVANADGNLYALDAATGSERWRYSYPAEGISGLVVSEGVVYFGSAPPSTVYAVGADNGVELWRFTPVIDGGILADSHEIDPVFPTVAEGSVYIKLNDNLYAIDAASGQELWRIGVVTVFDDNWFGAISNNFMVQDGMLFAVGDTFEERFGAFDARSGEEIWRSSAPQRNNWIVSIDAEEIYVRDSENLFALDVRSGASLWTTNVADYNAGIRNLWISVDDDLFYVPYAERLSALDKGTREEIWRFTAEDGHFVERVVLGSGVVLCELRDINTALGGTRGQQVVALVPATLSLKAGGVARVTTSTALRGGPSPTAVERAVLEPDTMVTITGESETTGDIVWWPVTVDETGDQGWVDASALEPSASGSA